MRLVLPTLMLAIGATTAHGQADPTATVATFHQALRSGDSATALRLLGADVVIYESGGVEVSRDEYRQHHLPADMRFAAASSRSVTRQTSGNAGDVAWVLTETRTTGTFSGRAIDSRGTETMLLRRTTEGWRIVHVHWSSRRAP